MQRLWKGLDRLVETLIFICFLSIVLVGAAQVFNRYFLNYSLSWSEEFQRYGQIWLVFLGIPVAYRYGMHIGMDTLARRLPAGQRRLFVLAVDLLWCALALALIVGVWQMQPFLQYQRSPGLGIPMTWAYGGLMFGAGYMLLVGLRRILANGRGRTDFDRHEGEESGL